MAFLAVYGHVNVDHILLVDRLPVAETTVPVERSFVRLGGTGGNIARAAAALGVPTSLAAYVGDDFPAGFRATLEASGIDLTDLRRVQGSTPRVWILTGKDEHQSAIIDQGVMGDGVEAPALDYAWMSSEWVHFTTGDPAKWLAAAQEASRAGKKIVFDPAQELSYRYEARIFERFLNLCDAFVCNETELERALAVMGYADVHLLFDHTDRIVVTRGARGVRLLERKSTYEVPAFPLRDVDRVNVVGAGDAFRGGLYAGLRRAESWPEAIRTGCAAAALYLEHGGDRFPSWDAVAVRRSASP